MRLVFFYIYRWLSTSHPALSKIIYTETDEAPMLATYSLLPVIQRFAVPLGIQVRHLLATYSLLPVIQRFAAPLGIQVRHLLVIFSLLHRHPEVPPSHSASSYSKSSARNLRPPYDVPVPYSTVLFLTVLVSVLLSCCCTVFRVWLWYSGYFWYSTYRTEYTVL